MIWLKETITIMSTQKQYSQAIHKQHTKRIQQKFIERKNDILKKFTCSVGATICLCSRSLMDAIAIFIV